MKLIGKERPATRAGGGGVHEDFVGAFASGEGGTLGGTGGDYKLVASWLSASLKP